MTLEPRAPHKLLFKRPLFHVGLNLTVRLGGKWYRDTRPGDRLIIVDTEEQDKEILRTRVLFTTHGPLNEIPEAWLRYEHDPSCRTREGLYEELCRVYAGGTPERPVDLDEGTESMVSCILFVAESQHFWQNPFWQKKTESDIMEEALDRKPPVR